MFYPSFLEKKFRGGCNSVELQPPRFWTVYFPSAPLFNFLDIYKIYKPSKCFSSLIGAFIYTGIYKHLLKHLSDFFQ